MTVIATPGMAAPFGSLTLPWIDPEIDPAETFGVPARRNAARHRRPAAELGTAPPIMIPLSLGGTAETDYTGGVPARPRRPLTCGEAIGVPGAGLFGDVAVETQAREAKLLRRQVLVDVEAHVLDAAPFHDRLQSREYDRRLVRQLEPG